MKTIFFLLSLCLFSSSVNFSQNNTVNSLLWQVSGNGLQKPSYLFGTYHFLSNGFIDAMKAVKNAYKATDGVIGELIIDTSIQRPTMDAEMNNAYISQNLGKLQQLVYGGSYTPEEIKILLDDRNNYWMQQLPKLMQDQSLFVAVGALHLVGKSGLVSKLREQGYTVTQINPRN